MAEDELPLEVHLGELRKRLLISIVVVGSLALLGMALFTKSILIWVQTFIPQGVELTVVTPMEYVHLWLLVSFYFALALGIPVVIYQAYKFMEPGLFPGERRFIYKTIPVSLLLFAMGSIVSLYFLLPISLKFVITQAEGIAQPLYSLAKFISFVLFTVTIGGLIFQIPLILGLGLQAGLFTIPDLKGWRKYLYPAFLGFSFIIIPDPTPITPYLVLIMLSLVFEASLIVLGQVYKA